MAKPRGPILQLRVNAPQGSRTVVIPKSFSFWNLHRVIQIAFAPGIQDATIEKRTYEYKQGETKPKKGKMTKMDCLSLNEGEKFEYSCNGVDYTIEVETAVENGEINNFIPRCIHGDGEKLELDAVNKKLMFKRFGMNPSMNKKPRQAPKIIVMAGEPDYMIWKTYMNAMRVPARAAEEY
ncbi:uncharacterized protein SPPG_04310 [Spizellomyces punctatus DAOM BR117]|uniref:Plasmid pRiA4b Orf3-like domain-containing protein n=1 Tax=Spizellomyces punctatus (strain DAOM BR117) TaxID=645134 RepID=A0A0L0HK70_SPIPD|nr:uncharacterized protein SPPG_04310 [Spizellomyces punctatus DAOM BR117]KND01219.1 hypothetical protein SPPG_04310 [Spizellomyces punctatus DAOM BR117]|eukprot:XP_016609258.1 hypothetical protein SPPG_04310 [Spizellomyces punctatus DAOM BR117]